MTGRPRRPRPLGRRREPRTTGHVAGMGPVQIVLLLLVVLLALLILWVVWPLLTR